MTTQKTIKTEKEYNFALRRIEELMDAKTGSSEFDELELLSTLAEIYEDKYRPTVVRRVLILDR
jgi:HTH-type transcriptional regulator/antitoxin HigA